VFFQHGPCEIRSTVSPGAASLSCTKRRNVGTGRVDVARAAAVIIGIERSTYSGNMHLLLSLQPPPRAICRPSGSPQEIVDARTDREQRRRFDEVTGYSGPRLAAADLRQVRECESR
jgi:hypothetical protein